MSSRGKILLVDDDPRNVKLMSARLRALGYEVLEAADGAEGLAVLRSTPVDVVLSDVMMPVLDGIELTQHVRANPALAGLPVLLITALDATLDRVRGLEAGADDFLSKPVNAAELELRVRGHVRMRRLQQELGHRSEILGMTSAAPPDTDPGRVFVLDDDTRWTSVLATRLRAAGYELETAHDLGSGFERAVLADADVMIVDLLLPDGSGLDFIEMFRRRAPDRHIPTIVVVSGIDEASEKLSCLRYGADDYLTKPIAPEELLARIQAQVRRARASRAVRAQAERAQTAAFTDPLTGLYNRRFLDEDLVRRVERAAKGQTGFALAMVDIDHFKRVNDTYGHPTGDSVLTMVGRRLYKTLRESDLACRFGGEEFCVVLPGTSIADAAKGMERARAAIHRLECPPVAQGGITVSVGLAEWRAGAGAYEVLQRADEALYAAKRGGRNRLELAPSFPTHGGT